MSLHSLEAKGIVGLVGRAGLILSRFGPTPRRMNRNLTRYAAIADEFHFRPTLAITATVLARHVPFIRHLSDRGIEFAIHGLVHVDHKSLTLEEQERSIACAATIFDRAGIPCSGFRAPYLRYNPATEDALRRCGFAYHSSQAIAFPVLRNGPLPAYRRVLDYYRATDARVAAVRPSKQRGLIHIPVAVPDDEIMVDRLRLGPAEQTAAWLGILEATHRRGDLFTVQLHPERIFKAEAALRSVLMEVTRRQPAVWVASLGAIADWWQKRERFRIDVTPAGPARYRVHVDADDSATLLVRAVPEVPATQWFGLDSVTPVRDFQVDGERKPVVGVSGRTPAEVVAFLHEEGLPTEISNDRSQFGAYIDVGGAWQQPAVIEAIEQAPGPLVRLWRWPSGARSALAVTGDIDSITLQDFAVRLYEGSFLGRARALRGSLAAAS
jgi:peptidoglycan/xylan/chitin deacetylase (PgdA/CDA1 family)